MGQLFGTDGIRGVANKYPMTPEMAVKIGKAAAIAFRNGKARPVILIGKDPRISGYMIEYALTSGICSMGADVLLVGPMPTPAIALLTKSFAADAGIMISASHNPYEDNGIKFFDKNGFKLAEEKELLIEKIIFDEIEAEDKLLGHQKAHISGDKIGKAFRIDDAAGRYVEFVKATIHNNRLAGIKIVIDCANGASYKVAPCIFKELGANVIVLNNQPNGLNINLNSGSLFPEIIRKAVLENNADLGVAYDGDADRVIMVDELGNELDGDAILAICARVLAKKGKLVNRTVVATIMSNIGLDLSLKEEKISLERTDVGDRNVVEKMRKEGHVLGGEQSGHIIFLNYSTTGDGILTSLQIASAMKESGKKLSELSKVFSKKPQVLVNVKVKEKKPIESLEASKVIAAAEKKLAGKGRILVRYSGTQNLIRVMVEGEKESVIEDIASEIVEALESELNG
ncbi:MAG: phosphoglucosamine mutase [Nanoarchaeota archaeon]|nr:phosphoglucosamine mutase [Nanoarchaeota archaeon]